MMTTTTAPEERHTKITTHESNNDGQRNTVPSAKCNKRKRQQRKTNAPKKHKKHKPNDSQRNTELAAQGKKKRKHKDVEATKNTKRRRFQLEPD